MGHGKNHVIDRRRFVQASSVAAAALALGATGCASSHPVAETGGTTTQFVAGTYQATALGKKSDITVEVVFSDTAIDSVRVVDHGETERIAAPAFEKIPEIIVSSQSLAVDAVTGATLSSLALLSAVEDCARQADGDVSALKRAEVRMRPRRHRRRHFWNGICTSSCSAGSEGRRVREVLEHGRQRPREWRFHRVCQRTRRITRRSERRLPEDLPRSSSVQSRRRA